MPAAARRLLPLVLLLLGLASGCSVRPAGDGGSEAASRAADIARKMVGSPYRFGGSTPAGFDCSGLVLYSYSRAGVRLPHGTDHLFRYSRKIPRGDIQRGDLLFFDQLGKKASHVAIYLGNDEFVHAPSTGKTVYIAKLSERYWQDHFSQARRVDVD